jgi:meiotic recombination protein REC8, fungi type
LPLPDAPPFSPLPHAATPSAEQAPQSSFSRLEEVPSSAEAHQYRVRAPKVTQDDWPQELANADLASWNANYLANMAEATKIKQQHKAVSLAKKNAAFWVLGRGIADVGICSRDDRVPNLLAIFSGHTLLKALTGRERSPSRMKRTRSPSDDRDEEGKTRRVRARGEDEQELGRDDAVSNDAKELILGADDSMAFPGEDVVCMCPSLTVIC